MSECLINRIEPVYRPFTNQDNAKKKNEDFIDMLKNRAKEKETKHARDKETILV